MKKPRCPDYKEECHQLLGVFMCRDGEHKGEVECPVISKSKNPEEA